MTAITDRAIVADLNASHEAAESTVEAIHIHNTESLTVYASAATKNKTTEQNAFSQSLLRRVEIALHRRELLIDGIKLEQSNIDCGSINGFKKE